MQDTQVFHWHGDNLALPAGAVNLAATPDCPHQAFLFGHDRLGSQFHAEIDVNEIEAWLIGHAAELAQAGLDPGQPRNDSQRFGPALKEVASVMFAEWLDRFENIGNAT